MEKLLFINWLLVQSQKESKKIVDLIKTHHYREKLHFIGDVHPFYDHFNREWLLYYLQPGGQYNSLLSTSKDLKNWESSPLSFKGEPRAKYFVVAIMNHKKMFYSWYGQNFVHVCSKSKDGRIWEADSALDIPVNKKVSTFGERDPYVVFDKVTNRFYALALAYIKSKTDCAIVLKKTQNNDLTKWEDKTEIVLRFPNNDIWTTGEPECPQLMKIGRRWYIFGSLAHLTTHHVGGLSYWIGDIDKSPSEVNWSTKTKQTLTSEDLCASQLVQKDKNFYAMGWIPQDYHGNEWGGHVNLPLKIKAIEDGKLTTSFDLKYLSSLKKNKVLTINNEKTICEPLPSNQMCQIVASIVVTKPQTISISNNENRKISILLDSKKPSISVSMEDPIYLCASMEIPLIDFSKPVQFDLIFEHDMIEININKIYTLHARVGRPISKDILNIDFEKIIKLEMFTFSNVLRKE